MAIHAREAHLPTLDEHRRREIGNELQATLNWEAATAPEEQVSARIA
jgi:hypothetical protein